MTTLKIKTPKWAVPLLKPARYKGAHGGRGSGKSHFFAEMLLEEHLMDPNTCSVCVREIQQSLDKSVKRDLEIKIEEMGIADHFIIQHNVIKNRHGKGEIVFQGMQSQTADNIKSLAGFDRAWVEEAQSLSHRSLELLRPTIRKPGSELWFTWNPNFKTDAVDELLRCENPPPDSIVVEVNYMDNPWFPQVLRDEMEYDRSRSIDKYHHVWMGGYIELSETRVFTDWKILDFETDPDAVFQFGCDFGFSVDPTVLIRCYLKERTLYIDHELVLKQCETIDMPKMFLSIPESQRYIIVADSSRPETISHLKRHGFPKVMPSLKGKNSVIEGIELLKGYRIVVHPRCEETINELSFYSYATDKDSGKVLPEIAKGQDDHCIDALRYACESFGKVVSRQMQYAAPSRRMMV
jgi:phage terminase large subunit